MKLERETRVELATLCLGSIGLGLIVNPLDSESSVRLRCGFGKNGVSRRG